MRVTRGRLLVGTKITWEPNGFIIIPPELDKVWEVLTTDLKPREHLDGEHLELYRHVVYAGGLLPEDEPLWTAPMVALLHDCETRLKIRPELIRAACHLIWGRPSYPGAGTLTLCDPSDEAGALTLAHESGGLEVMR